MKIAILGTKGIPNQYGGFEQFAEYLSVGLVERGHEVTVYSPHFHPYKDKDFKGVKVKHVFCPENILGGGAHFIYDHLCLSDAYTHNDFDIIFEAGYASCAPSLQYFKSKKRKPLVFTNMDGLEWRRNKWNRLVQKLTKRSEKLAVSQSHVLISDNIGIQNYLLKAYNKNSYFIPYGADLIVHHNPSLLGSTGLEQNNYFLVIARLEPENNVEVIIKAFIKSQSNSTLAIVGGLKTKHAKHLLKYKVLHSRIVFLGSIYDKKILDSLRFYSKAYFHGHSVGGTNPSLLEAMADESFIVAHDNEFNRSVLENNALFFSNENDLADKISRIQAERDDKYEVFTKRNIDLIHQKYNWRTIIDSHENLFLASLESTQKSNDSTQA